MKPQLDPENGGKRLREGRVGFLYVKKPCAWRSAHLNEPLFCGLHHCAVDSLLIGKCPELFLKACQAAPQSHASQSGNCWLRQLQCTEVFPSQL